MARLRVTQNLGEESFLAIHSKKANAFHQISTNMLRMENLKYRKPAIPLRLGQVTIRTFGWTPFGD